MGIVRDITVEELKQAVNNIDTSTLAQDSTLQDVVTAIQNISGGSDPVTNTTVNSLCKDTTGQSIASAISGLGQALGANKADIDGGNIANPSTFRSNIGIKSISVSNTSLANNINVPNLNTYRFGIFHLRYSVNQRWYTIPFDVANIPSEGINLQVFINNNLYISTVNVIKATNTIYMTGFTGIDDIFITLYS